MRKTLVSNSGRSFRQPPPSLRLPYLYTATKGPCVPTRTLASLAALQGLTEHTEAH